MLTLPEDPTITRGCKNARTLSAICDLIEMMRGRVMVASQLEELLEPDELETANTYDPDKDPYIWEL